MFKAFDEDGNGILDQNEIGRLNATIYNIFPRFGYKGKELPGKCLFDSIINLINMISCIQYFWHITESRTELNDFYTCAYKYSV